MTDDRKPIEPTSDQGTNSPDAADDAGADSLRNAVGAYLLDALPDAERDAFESFLPSSPETLDELRDLAPVVALLPKLLDLEQTAEPAPEPSAELRDRILAVAIAEQVPADSTTEASMTGDPVIAVPPAKPVRAIRTAPEPTALAGTSRPQGRIRAGMSTAPDATAAPSVTRMVRQIPGAWLAAAAIALVAIGSILWGLALQGRIDSKNREIAAQSVELANLRSNANATSYSLASDDGGPAGTVLFSLKDQIGVLYVRDLPELEPGKVYQIWYLKDQVPAPKPGGTFTVDSNGNGFSAVESDTPDFDLLAITAEPEGGSAAPTSEIVLSGRLGGAAG